MKRFRVEVRELKEEVVRDRNDELVEKRSRLEKRLDLGFSVSAEVPGDALRNAKEAFAKSDAGQLMLIRSCTSGPGGTINLVVCRHRVVARAPKGWVWKRPPSSDPSVP